MNCYAGSMEGPIEMVYVKKRSRTRLLSFLLVISLLGVWIVARIFQPGQSGLVQGLRIAALIMALIAVTLAIYYYLHNKPF